MGNLFFASFFLKYKNFNLALEKFTKYFDLSGKIFNVTDGKNLYLHSLSKTGQIFTEEEDIIENKKKYTLDELYLFKKISNKFLKKIDEKDIEYKKKYLKKINYIPNANLLHLVLLKKVTL